MLTPEASDVDWEERPVRSAKKMIWTMNGAETWEYRCDGDTLWWDLEKWSLKYAVLCLPLLILYLLKTSHLNLTCQSFCASKELYVYVETKNAQICVHFWTLGTSAINMNSSNWFG